VAANDATVFRAASLSKPVFAYLVFTLVNEGRLDLDKPLHQYLEKSLPEYPEYADLAADARYQTITARLALSHRSEFPNWRWQTKEGKLGFEFKPGEKFLYSGEGVSLPAVRRRAHHRQGSRNAGPGAGVPAARDDTHQLCMAGPVLR
jgi:CubicO group peptidase (beta-lactamase class C family)